VLLNIPFAFQVQQHVDDNHNTSIKLVHY